MKTRRSPRNQMMLWKALGGPAPALKPRADSLELVEQAEKRLNDYQCSPFANPRTLNQLRADVNRAKVQAAKQRALEGKYK